MHALNTELKGAVVRHVQQANDGEMLQLLTALYGRNGSPPSTPPATAELKVPAPRWDIRTEATVRDRTTGLTWTRRNVSDKRLPWAEAKEACEKLELEGGGWRMPTIKDLLTLVDYERYDPCIDTEVFSCEPAWYWTSTPYAPSPGDAAWVVHFHGGSAGYGGRDRDGFVRAVRGGQ